MTKRIIFICMLCMTTMMAMANGERPFECYLYNDELKVFLRLNLYEKDITVPGQEIFGEMDGYMGSTQCAHVWTVTKSKIVNGKKAEITLINNYGSEDLRATITRRDDNTYVYKFVEGSTLKFPVNRKWQKLPKTFTLTRKQE